MDLFKEWGDALSEHYKSYNNALMDMWDRRFGSSDVYLQRLSSMNVTLPRWYMRMFESMQIRQYIKAYLVGLLMLYLVINCVWSIYYIGCSVFWNDDGFGIWNVIVICVNSVVIAMYGIPYILVHYVHKIRTWDIYHGKNVVDIYTLHLTGLMYHVVMVSIQVWNLVLYGVVQNVSSGSDEDILVYRVFAASIAFSCLFNAMLTWTSQRGYARSRMIKITERRTTQ